MIAIRTNVKTVFLAINFFIKVYLNTSCLSINNNIERDVYVCILLTNSKDNSFAFKTWNSQ